MRQVRCENQQSLITQHAASLGKALKRIREAKGLTQAALADKIGTSRIALSRWEAGAQPPSLGPLYRWLVAVDLVSPEKPTIVTVTNISAQLHEAIKQDPELLKELSPSQFEQFVAGRLDRMGYNVQLTGGTSLRDGGIDLIAVPKTPSVTSFILAGQVKHHRGDSKTKREAVDRLLSWQSSPFSMELLVTNTGFTKDALWAASQDRSKNFLRLRDFEDLKRWIQDNFWSEKEWREIPDEVELAPGIRIKIPKLNLSGLSDLWPDSLI